jgi:hypothetical protein
MENKISNEYIEHAINELERLFEIKEPVICENIFPLIHSGKVKASIKLIALQLGLPIDINITNVPNDYRAQNDGNQFQSTHLVKVHRSRSGSEGIIAQVTIPEGLPSYGSSTLIGYPINVKISENCKENSVVFTMIIAHELSHVLLYSLRHSKKENEFYTDLTAMMLGFQSIFQDGRKNTITTVENGVVLDRLSPHFQQNQQTTKTQTTTYGYLNDNQFNFAHNKINLILKRNRERNRERKNLLSGELKNIKKLVAKYDKTFLKFKKFIKHLSINPNKNITGDDSKKIITFFQLGYIDKLDSSRKEYSQKIETIDIFLKVHSTEQENNQVSNYINELKSYKKKLENKLTYLEEDVKILKKYVSLFFK